MMERSKSKLLWCAVIALIALDGIYLGVRDYLPDTYQNAVYLIFYIPRVICMDVIFFVIVFFEINVTSYKGMKEEVREKCRTVRRWAVRIAICLCTLDLVQIFMIKGRSGITISMDGIVLCGIIAIIYTGIVNKEFCTTTNRRRGRVAGIFAGILLAAFMASMYVARWLHAFVFLA